MSGFVTRLIARNRSQADVLRPHVRSLFEPQPGVIMPAWRRDGVDDPSMSVEHLYDDGGDEILRPRDPVGALPRQASAVAPGVLAESVNPISSDAAHTRIAEAGVAQRVAAGPASFLPAADRADSRLTEAGRNTANVSSSTHQTELKPGAADVSPRLAVEGRQQASPLLPSIESSARSRYDAPALADAQPTRLDMQNVGRAPRDAVFQHASSDLPRPALSPQAVAQALDRMAPPGFATRDLSRRNGNASRESPRDQDPEPTVHVTIGRIEIRAEQAPSRSVQKPREGPQAASLADYLRNRTAKGRA